MPNMDRSANTVAMSTPAFVRDDPCALADGHELVGRDAGDDLARATRPEDLDADGRGRPETEVEPWIVRGIETRLADHRLRLHSISCVYQDAGADGAPVRLDAFELHLDPVP